MIFFADNSGTIIKSLPSPVYQGAANANDIYLIAPFMTNMSCALAFRLPNTQWTQPHMMTPQRELEGIIEKKTGKTYSGWSYRMPNEVTEQYGTVTVQFFFYAPTADGEVTAIPATASASFEVGRGVVAELPDTPTQTIYEEILAALSQLQSDLENGYWAARAIYQWSSAFTYGAEEITFYPVGEFGAFVKSISEDNTQPPYNADGTVNSAYWEEVVNFDHISEDYFNDLKDLVSQAQGFRDEAEQIVEQGKADIQGILTDGVNEINQIIDDADTTFNQYLDRAEDAADRAEDAAQDIAQYVDRAIRFVETLPETGEEGYLYATVSDGAGNLFTLWAWQDGKWVNLGEANLVVPFSKIYAIRLYPASWSSNKQAVTIDGLSPQDDAAMISYPGFAADLVKSGVLLSAIVENGLEFSCTSAPSKAVMLYVIVTKEQEVPTANGYYTDAQVDALLADKQDIVDDTLTTTAKTVPAAINENKAAIDGLREEIVDSAHFQGFATDPTAVRAIPADANDYCYCISTGTIWTYGDNGWEDSGKPYPSDAVPKSTTVPMMDGTAAVGDSNTYAAGDHVHPTDTSRASAAALQTETANRTQQDAALDTKITQEATARQTADNAINANLAAEVTAREQAVSALQESLTAETTAREQAVASLESGLADETAARQSADAALGTRIDNIEGGTVEVAKATEADHAASADTAASATSAQTAQTAASATTAGTADKVAHALTVGSKVFDGSAAVTVTKEDLGVGDVYTAAGSVAFANLPAPSASNVGQVYNVTDAFTTDDRFLEGADKAYPAGTNVGIIENGGYFYDVLGGFIDTSNFATKTGSFPQMTVGTAGYADSAAEADTAGYAQTAKADAAGNDIQTTYATKSELAASGNASFYEAPISIPTSAWSANTVTLTADDSPNLSKVLPSSFICFWVSAASAAAKLKARVKVSAYAAGSVTLQCTTVPTAAITGSITIQ